MVQRPNGSPQDAPDPRAGSRGPYKAGLRRRAEIIDAAVEVFANSGYRAGTIKDIADLVGITPAAVLRYFSKEELLMEALRYWDERQSWVRVEKKGLAFFRELAGLMRDHIEHRGLLELYLTVATEASGPEHPGHDFIRSRFASSNATMQRKIREAVSLGEIPTMTDATVLYEASCMYAMLDGLEVQWLLNPNVDLGGFVAEYVDQAIARWKSGAEASARISAHDPWAGIERATDR